ncbi:Clp protease N-terminal domain-containing protein, partial [Oleiphilus sp. HI0079]
MRIDRLTSKLQMALSDAQSIALGKDNQFIEPVHLIHALLDQNGSVSSLLKQLGVDLPKFKADVVEALDSVPQVQG